jgi:hypothetical protein
MKELSFISDNPINLSYPRSIFVAFGFWFLVWSRIDVPGQPLL